MYDVCNGSGTGSVTLQLTVGSGSAGTPLGTASGDLVIVCANSSASFNVTNVTDTQSNSYAVAVSDANTGDQGAIWSSKTTTALVAGTDKITVTFSGSTGQQNVIVKGAAGVSAGTVDQTAHSGASSTGPSSGATGPLTQANELVIGMIGNANTGGIPSALPWGGAGTTVHASGTGPYLTVFTESVSATAALTAIGTLAATSAWCCLAATWKLSNTGALTITTTTPPADSTGNNYNAGTGYTLAATGGSGSGYTWSIKSGSLPPGLSLDAGNSGGHVCGNTIKKSGTTAVNVALYNNWNTKASSGGLGLYTAQSRKCYFLSPNGSAGGGSFPVNAGVAAWESANVEVGAALNLGMGMFLCYKPVSTGTTADPNWGSGGAIYAATGNSGTAGTILGDYALMKASIQSIQSACTSAANGANIAGIVLWQECDGHDDNLPAFAASHNYYAYYPLLKADFPHIPVLISYINFPHGTAAQDAADRMKRFPGPHPLNPNGWGTATVNGNSTNLFCDGITTDEYADGAYGDTTPSGTLSTSSTGRLRYMYAEPDLYTPAKGTTPASGNPGWCDVADYNGISWGNLETGNNASSGTPDILQMQAYLVGVPLASPAPIGNDKAVHSILSVYQTRIANNAPIVGMLWYENADNPPPPAGTGQNNIIASSDPRIPWLNAIDAATAQSVGSVISGTLTTDTTVTYPHTYSVVVKVKDSAGTTATATLGFAISAAAVTLAVTTTTLTGGNAGQAYSMTLANNGGGSGSGYTWTLNAGSLSGSGLTLSSAGVISGSTPVAGTYSGLQFKVTDSSSNTALSATGMSIVIAAAGVTVTITSVSPLPNGTTGNPYVTTLNASGGTGPYTYALAGTSPALPSGLIIDNTVPLKDQAGIPLTDQAGVNLEDQTGVP